VGESGKESQLLEFMDPIFFFSYFLFFFFFFFSLKKWGNSIATK